MINNVTVAGVPYFDLYKSCLQCKVRVKTNSDYLGQTRLPDNTELCPQHSTAKLMLLYENERVHKPVFAFAYRETVKEIAGCDDVIVEVLAKIGTFKSITLVKEKDIIKDVKSELSSLLLSSTNHLTHFHHH